MGTYVLIHGSWHGGWCWDRTAQLLRRGGNEVWAPTLTGLGDRAHLAGPDVGLTVHIGEVARLLVDEDLTDVVLVGASYGGPVISGAAGRHPERVRHLVFVDGLVPEAGQSCFDLMPGVRDRFVASAAAAGSTWSVPPPPPQFFGVTDRADVAWMEGLLTPMPLLTHDEPLPAAPPGSLPGTYIRCARFPFDQQAAPAAARGYRIVRLDADHDVQVTHPAMAAKLLASV